MGSRISSPARDNGSSSGIELLPLERNRRHWRNPVHHLDLIAVRLGQPHALAAAGLVDVLDSGCSGRFGDALEVILARGVIGKAHEFRLAFLGDMDVVVRIGAAHVERGRCALGAYHPEPRKKLFHDVEIGGAQPPVGHIRYFDECHRHFPMKMSVRSFASKSRTRREIEHFTPGSAP